MLNPLIDDFATPEFIEANTDFYDRYVQLRVHGYPSYRAFIRVFGAEHWADARLGSARIDAIESTGYYQTKFREVLEATKLSELWNEKKAMHDLLSLVRDPLVKCSTQLAAAKELNVLAGITFVDKSGNTRAGRSLNDFYQSIGVNTKPTKQTGETAKED